RRVASRCATKIGETSAPSPSIPLTLSRTGTWRRDPPTHARGLRTFEAPAVDKNKRQSASSPPFHFSQFLPPNFCERHYRNAQSDIAATIELVIRTGICSDSGEPTRDIILDFTSRKLMVQKEPTQPCARPPQFQP